MLTHWTQWTNECNNWRIKAFNIAHLTNTKVQQSRPYTKRVSYITHLFRLCRFIHTTQKLWVECFVWPFTRHGPALTACGTIFRKFLDVTEPIPDRQPSRNLPQPPIPTPITIKTVTFTSELVTGNSLKGNYRKTAFIWIHLPAAAALLSGMAWHNLQKLIHTVHRVFSKPLPDPHPNKFGTLLTDCVRL